MCSSKRPERATKRRSGDEAADQARIEGTGKVSANTAGAPEDDDATARRGLMYLVFGAFLNATIFLVVGPLIGCFVFMLMIGIAGIGSTSSPFVAAYTLGGLTLMGIPFAYVVGSLPAAVTGALVALASGWLKPPALYFFAVMVGGISAVMLTAMRWNQVDGLLSMLLYFTTGAAAALVCMRIARPFRLGPEEART
jgi:hypothetical protein